MKDELDLVVRFLDPSIGSLIDDGSIDPATSMRYSQVAERAKELLAALSSSPVEEAPADVAGLVKSLLWWGRPNCRIQNAHAPLKKDCREAAAVITRLSADLAEARKVIEGLLSGVHRDGYVLPAGKPATDAARQWLSQQGDQS